MESHIPRISDDDVILTLAQTTFIAIRLIQIPLDTKESLVVDTPPLSIGNVKTWMTAGIHGVKGNLFGCV